MAVHGNTLVAVWYRSSGLRQTGWGLSLDGGGTWLDGGWLPLHPSGGGNFGQPTVCVDQTGRFYAASLYGLGGLGVAHYRGTPGAGGLTWDGPTFAVALVSRDPDLDRPLEAPRLTCDPERGYLYLSYTRSRALSSTQFEYTIEFVRSLDGGTTWSVPQVLSSGTACNGSRPAVGPDGELYVLWEDFSSRQVRGRRSVDFGASFGVEFVAGEIRDNLGAAPSAWRSPSWRRNPLYPLNIRLGSDFPSLALDRSSGPYRGRIYATWTDHAEGTTGPASLLRYEGEPNNLFALATPVAIGEDFRGSLPASEFNLDGDRFTFTGTGGTLIQISGRLLGVFPPPNSPQVLAYNVHCGDDTLLFSALVNHLLPEGFSPGPPFLYTLPVDGRYYIALAGDHFLSYDYEVSLRAVSPSAGQAARDHRDVVLTWSDNGGASWAAKRRVSDAALGYDESFPSVAVDELGRVHLAWYDRRDNVGCAALAHTYWTYSVDGGATFTGARRLSSAASSWRFADPWLASNIGDHLGLATGEGRVHLLWTDTRGVDADIYAVRIGDVPTGIAVPRFTAEAVDGHIRLAWTVRDATGITGFRLHRAEGGNGAFALLEEEPQPVRGPGEYQAEDRSVRPGAIYRYRLEVLRGGSPSDWEGPVEAALPAAVMRLAWQGGAPNPFSRSVILELAAPRAGKALVRVYDLAGHEVATLYRGALPAGVRSFTWEGRDEAGREVAAGVYLVRADLAGESTSLRLVRVR